MKSLTPIYLELKLTVALGASCESIEVSRDDTLRKTTKALMEEFDMEIIDEKGWSFYIPKTTLYVNQYKKSIQGREFYSNLTEARWNKPLRDLFAIQPDETTISLIAQPPGAYLVADSWTFL